MVGLENHLASDIKEKHKTSVWVRPRQIPISMSSSGLARNAITEFKVQTCLTIFALLSMILALYVVFQCNTTEDMSPFPCNSLTFKAMIIHVKRNDLGKFWINT